MKVLQFKKLIREEVFRILKEEEYQPSYLHVKPHLPKLSEIIRALESFNDKIEDGGPLSEEIEDALEILRELFKKAQESR